MAYVVVAGYATVETDIGPGRARVDLSRGTVLPADVPAEDRERLLAAGSIEEIDGEVGDATDPDAIPDGSIAVVLAWVGDDLRRAREALAAEQLRGDKARMGLVNELSKLSA